MMVVIIAAVVEVQARVPLEFLRQVRLWRTLVVRAGRILRHQGAAAGRRVQRQFALRRHHRRLGGRFVQPSRRQRRLEDGRRRLVVHVLAVAAVAAVGDDTAPHVVVADIKADDTSGGLRQRGLPLAHGAALRVRFQQMSQNQRCLPRRVGRTIIQIEINQIRGRNEIEIEPVSRDDCVATPEFLGRIGTRTRNCRGAQIEQQTLSSLVQFGVDSQSKMMN